MSKRTVMQTLAVVMACHNRREKTLSCLRALDQQRLNDSILVEVYLLDDGSTDGTSEAVRKEFPDINILSGDGNLYWNRGMRKSFSAAIQKGFDYYLWLNDDCILYKNSLDVLLNTYVLVKSRSGECAIIGSAMHDPDSHQFTYGGVRRHRGNWGRITLERIAPTTEAIQCDATNGNCVLIPASVVKKVGNLDKKFKHRWGDHDYCFRALQQGCSVWLAPGYLGTCEENPIDGTWEDASLPLVDRMRKLNSPHGYQLLDYSIYMRRHRGAWWIGHLVWPYIKIISQTVSRKLQSLCAYFSPSK
jgi:GT2 family glycosyltransferase